MLRKLSQTINYKKVYKVNKLLNNRLFSSVNHQINNSFIDIQNKNLNQNNGLNEFVTRSHTCGQLSELNVGQKVTLCGWIQYQRLGKFITLRDSYGVTQLFIDNNNKQLQKKISKLMPESVIEICGHVSRRPDKDINPKLKTGTIEVIVDEMKACNECRNDIPFIIRDYSNVNEKTRLQFRYIDLRHERMQFNLRLRSQVIMKMRQFLADKYGFVEVETPTLFKKTPGGAQEYVVPTQFPDSFYSLVQSPQQFKQLLMIGAIDRYFQIARCYRDEGTRPDRQPEFTQLDIEMSFTTADGIMALIEELIKYCWPFNDENITIPFQRMKYADANRDYGSDKPDLRSDIKLKEMSEINDLNSIDASVSNPCCVTLVIPECCAGVNEKIKSLVEELSTIQKQLKFKGKLFHTEINEQSNWKSIPDLSESLKEKITNEYSLRDNDFLWVAIGGKDDVYRLMGRIRADCVRMIEELRELNGEDYKLSFVWIVDFPLFLPKEDSDMLESSHHPFTAPKSKDSQLLYSNPSQVLGEHFDLVLNGQEVGGGSIRIHDHQMQEFVLKNILKEDVNSMQYFLDALRSGCPPHGGIALGLDRLMSIICKTDSIRDVMAFPKSAHGKDLMAGSPTAIPQSVKKLYNLK